MSSFYTTPTKVREDAGFVGNTNITDAQIASIIDLMESEIDSYISHVYQLPLPIFYRNEIVFSGAGTGSGTLTITIDSTDFAISVTNGMTAEQAADAFRTLVLSETSLDFLLEDGLGHGATVVIVSANQSENIADVTITSTDPQTVGGITATGGSVKAVPVPLISNIARGMAGARLMIQEYGEETQDMNKDGFSRMAFFREMLESIKNKKTKLLDFTKSEIGRTNTQRLAFYPTEASRTQDTNPTENKFTMNTKF